MSTKTNSTEEVYLISLSNINYEVENGELPTELEFTVATSLIDQNDEEESIMHAVEEHIGQVTGRCFAGCTIEKSKVNVSVPIDEISKDLTIDEANEIMSRLSDNYSDCSTANDARAKSGWGAISSYTSTVYLEAGSEPAEQGIRDLLTDLQHTCDSLNLDFKSLIERATKEYAFFKNNSVE